MPARTPSGLELGRRVRLARERAGLSQTQLALRVEGLDDTAVSKIEKGKRRLEVLEFADIAEALGVSLRSLVGRQGERPRMRLAARLAGAKELGEAGGYLRTVLEVGDVLDELGSGGLIERVDPPRVEVISGDPQEVGEEAADQVRLSLTLGDAPVSSIIELAEERFCVEVAYLPLGGGDSDVDGAIVAQGSTRVVVANSDKEWTRLRFTVAHELGHLVFDDLADGDWLVDRPHVDDLAERRAGAFAAALLMPETAVRRLASRHGVGDRLFAELCFVYGASMKAAALRLMQLGLTSEHDADALFDWTPEALAVAHGFEPYLEERAKRRGTTRPPGVLFGRATSAYRSGLIGVALVAALAREDDERMRERLALAGVVPSASDDGFDEF